MTDRKLFSGSAGPPGPPGPVTEDQLPWVVELDPILGDTAQVADTVTRTVDALCFGAGYISLSHATLTCSVTWDVVLASATWAITVMYVKDTDSGVLSVLFNGAAVTPASVNAAGALARNQIASFSVGVSSAAPSPLEINIPATKVMHLQKIQLRRQP